LDSKYKSLVGSLLGVYFFISSIVPIKSSVMRIGESLAGKIILLIRDTTRWVFAGRTTMALPHSSGDFNSIIVAYVSSVAMLLWLVVAIIMGAEMV